MLQELLQIARENNLIVFADEIYDKILYDGEEHTSIVPPWPMCLLFITFNGLSKTVLRFRAGWMVISGAKHRAESYIEGPDMLASMRLCAVRPQPARHPDGPRGLPEHQTGAAHRQTRSPTGSGLGAESIPGVSCVKPNPPCTCSRN